MDYRDEVQFRLDLKKVLADLDDELDDCCIGTIMPPRPWFETLRDVLHRRLEIRMTLKKKGAL